MRCSDGDEDEVIVNVECHFAQAEVGSCIFSLGDCAHIQVTTLFTTYIEY